MFNFGRSWWVAGVLPGVFFGLALSSLAVKPDNRLTGETVKSAVQVQGPEIPEIGAVPVQDAAKAKSSVTSADLASLGPTALGTVLPVGQASQAAKDSASTVMLRTPSEQALTGVSNQMVIIPRTEASMKPSVAHITVLAVSQVMPAASSTGPMQAVKKAAEVITSSIPAVKAEQKLYIMSAEVKKSFNTETTPEGKVKVYRENGIPVKTELQKTGGGMQIGENLRKYGDNYLPMSLTEYDKDNKFVATVMYTRDETGKILTEHQTNADGSTIDTNGNQKIISATDGSKQEYKLEGANWVLLSTTDTSGKVTMAADPVVDADGWATTYDPATGAPLTSTKDGVELSNYIPNPLGGEGFFATHQEKTVAGGKEITDSSIDPATGVQTDNIQFPDGSRAKVEHKEGDPVQEIWMTNADGSAGEHYTLNTETQEKISINPDGSQASAAVTDPATGIRTVNNPDGGTSTYDRDGKPLSVTAETPESTTISTDFVPDTSDPAITGAFTATTLEVTYKTGDFAGKTLLTKITVDDKGKGISYLTTDKATGEELEGGDL